MSTTSSAAASIAGTLNGGEDLAGIRGNLAVSETAKRALRSRARAACDFEELSADSGACRSPWSERVGALENLL